MLIHPILDKLQAMRFYGMRTAFEEQLQMADIDKLSFDERFGLLVDREQTGRADRRLKTRLRKAKLRHNASMEDVDFKHPRGLDKQLMPSLSSCEWIKSHHNVFIMGPTGIGKSYLACALAQKACREGYSALYLRLPKLFSELSLAKGDGLYGIKNKKTRTSFPKVFGALTKTPHGENPRQTVGYTAMATLA